MSTSLFVRPLPILLAAATLVACSSQPRPQQPESHLAHAPTSISRDPVGDTSILADVPIGAGWDVVGDAPILVDVPVGAGWDPAYAPPLLVEAVLLL